MSSGFMQFLFGLDVNFSHLFVGLNRKNFQFTVESKTGLSNLIITDSGLSLVVDKVRVTSPM